MAILRALVALVAALAALSLSRAQPMSDGMPSYEQFASTISGYPYRASDERLATVKARLRAMTRCMNKSKVQALLGTPDFSRLSYGRKGPGEEWLGSSWVYYLSMQSSLANERDSRVTVFFDTKGLSHWVTPANIEHAREIGGVGERCA